MYEYIHIYINKCIQILADERWISEAYLGGGPVETRQALGFSRLLQESYPRPCKGSKR